MVICLDLRLTTWAGFEQKGDPWASPFLPQLLSDAFHMKNMSSAQLDAWAVAKPRYESYRAEGLIVLVKCQVWVFLNSLRVQSRQAVHLIIKSFAGVSALQDFISAATDHVYAFFFVTNVFEWTTFILPISDDVTTVSALLCFLEFSVLSSCFTDVIGFNVAFCAEIVVAAVTSYSVLAHVSRMFLG